VVSFAVFLGALDQTVVVTALPAVIAEMHLPFTKLDQASWVVTGYLLGYTAAMPLMGRVSDVFGRRRVLVLALLAFAVTSVACARAWSLDSLVWARAFQAVGGGALVPVTMALVGDLFPAAERSIALGIVGAAAEAGGVLGPLYGAVIVHLASWRWIFWLNLPLSAVVAALCFVLLPRTKGLAEKIDYAGALLLGGGLVLLTVALTDEANAPRPLSQKLLLLLGFAICLASFVAREGRIGQALIELSMFRNVTFSAANVINFLVGSALIVAMVDVPLFSGVALGRSVLDSGLILVRLTALIPVGAMAGGFVCRRLGYRLTTAIGLACGAAGFFLMSRWGLGVSDWEMTKGLVLAGFGFGLVIAPITTAMLGAVRQAYSGVASALITVMRMVGMTIGIAALTTWGLARFNGLTSSISLPLPIAGETAAETEARVAAYQQQIIGASLTVFHDVFVLTAFLCLVALIPVLGLRRSPQTS